ncbi:potassium channel family protein [Nocardioides sp.]|uniref:potassium channel family protein n=1 Tax=Nocardioides sp. TaxID=35761 RepID=UPI003528C130
MAGIAVREAERGSPDANIANVWDGIWWAVTTVTTVGYGDYYPTTPLGRLIAVGLMLIGIALIGVVTGSIATWFVEKLEGTEEAVDAAIEEAGAVTDAKLAEVLVELREVPRLLEEGRSVAGSSG